MCTAIRLLNCCSRPCSVVRLVKAGAVCKRAAAVTAISNKGCCNIRLPLAEQCPCQSANSVIDLQPTGDERIDDVIGRVIRVHSLLAEYNC